MDHLELWHKIQEKLDEVDRRNAERHDAAIKKLDNYQRRITKLETNQGWITKGFLGIITMMTAAMMAYVEYIIKK